jgi:ABC-type transporter Mla MlaB component
MTRHQPSEFGLTVTTEPTTSTVYVAGELDHDTGDDLVATFVGHLGRHPGPREVRLDFRHLTWIDSAGLAALLMIHRHAGARVPNCAWTTAPVSSTTASASPTSSSTSSHPGASRTPAPPGPTVTPPGSA